MPPATPPPADKPKIRVTRAQAHLLSKAAHRRRRTALPLLLALLAALASIAFCTRSLWWHTTKDALQSIPLPDLPDLPTQPAPVAPPPATETLPPSPAPAPESPEASPSSQPSQSSQPAPDSPPQRSNGPTVPRSNEPPPPPSAAQLLYDESAALFNAALRDYRTFLTDKAANAHLLPSIQDRAAKAAQGFVDVRGNPDLVIPDIEDLISQSYRLVSDCRRQRMDAPKTAPATPGDRFNRGTVGPKRRTALPPASSPRP